MLDFVKVSDKNRKNGRLIRPEFCTDIMSTDLMIKGHAFYAIWDEGNHKWCKRKSDVSRLIDKDVREYINSKDEEYMRGSEVKWAKEESSGIMMAFVTFCKHIADDIFTPLDSKLIFKSDPYVKDNYSTHRLDYDIKKGTCPCYNHLINTLYDNEEREKIEWVVGAVLNGDGPKIQKFLVFYGNRGTGKSTVISIITEKLFKGYCSSFDAAALASSSSAFSMEPFKDNPIIAYQHDGNLSRIESNTKLNSIISHEIQPINEKNKSIYQMRITSVLIMGSNDKVKITNAKSGLLRRLLDVNPSGRLLSSDDYESCMNGIDFELGAIAYKCLNFYRKNKHKYDDYIPMDMMAGTNDFFDFVSSYYEEFIRDEEQDGYTSLAVAWKRYKEYVDDAAVKNQINRRAFADELSNYFKEGLHDEYTKDEEGKRIHLRSIYRGFKKDFMYVNKNVGVEKSVEDSDDAEVTTSEQQELYSNVPDWLHLSDVSTNVESVKANPLNVYLLAAFAQYAIEGVGGSSQPKKPWDNVTMKLSSIDTTREHYILTQSVDPKLIVIDFDLKDPTTGEKSLERNLMAAKMFPATYAETSKSGNGLHLHYIYDGDPDELSMVFDKEIEIKVFKGKSALRRKLYLCNNEPIAHISSGLPLKEVNKKMIDWEGVQNEKHLRALIEKGLQRKVFANTKPSIDYIAHVIEEAYDSGISYNVSDLQPRVLNMAYASTNNSDYCVEKVLSCEFMSEDNKDVGKQEAKLNETECISNDGEKPIIFIDSEVFPNLFVVCYKFHNGGGKENCVKLINPSSNEMSNIVNSYRMIGFNIRGYDAHLFYARILGYSNEKLYELSKKIIGKKTTGFKEALRMAYADIYDYTSLKQSLKLYEIDLGIHHQECPYKWDEPVPEDAWEEITDYCCNDVVSTEAVFDDPDRQADLSAREILSELSGLPIIDTTRQHCTKIIFGNERHPQLVYTDLSTIFPGYEFNEFGIDKDRYIKDEKGKPICTSGKSIYMGEDPSEGGFVFTRPGYYENVKCYDVSGMHPSSLIALNKFGEKTKIYADIVAIKTNLKHKEFDKIALLFDGKLKKYLTDETQAAKIKKGSKLISNSVYGYCSATFDNPFKDPRDKDNIVAKRGALFMITLKNEVIKRGYTVIHCKTDSIKVVNPDEEIEQFIFEFGKKYGYTFEIEEDFEKICLFNKAVFIGKDRNVGWMAVGAEFQHPYIFKTLFSHEPIAFDDMCESKTVTNDAAIYLDMNEELIKPYLREIENTENELACETVSSRKVDIKKRIKELKEEIEITHDLKFVGKFGNFCPVKPGFGGGIMLRMKDDKLGSVNGTKGYRWLESEYILRNHLEDAIDMSYFRRLVDEAVEHIEEYVNFGEFINN